MSFNNTLKFNTQERNKEILVFQLEELTEIGKYYIFNNLVEMLKGRGSHYDVKTLAMKISRFLSNQSNNIKYGAIAEFVSLCVLRQEGFSQEYCFRNLEENSIKKGFDGLFNKGESFWLLESKSTYSFKTHKNTIDKAYKGIIDMINGDTINDPWENAVNHAKISDSEDSLIKKMTELSIRYSSKDYLTIKDSNIILASSVYNEDLSLIEDDVELLYSYIKTHESKNELLLVNNISEINIIIDYFKDLE